MILLSREAVERSIQLAREKRNWPDERPAVRLMFTALAYHDAAARIEALERALRGVKDAWESLPEGNYRPWQVEEWLVKKMKPAIDTVRAALAQTGEPTG
jgi:hypothetical protein